MAKIAALFSGQGAQYPGMGKDLYDNYSQVREIYQCAGDVFGFDVARTSFEGEAPELMKTEVAQPVIFTLSVSAYTVAMEQMQKPLAVAGHSLGEYAALHCAGAYSLEDGMRLLKARASGMGRAAKENPGVMYAVVGKDAGIVDEVCRQVAGEVWPVNFNIPSQTVIAGETTACEKAAQILEGNGAKVVKLEVEGAFHTPLMEPAAQVLRQAAQACSFHATEIAFYSNVTGGELVIDDYPAYFTKHMLGPVRFVEQMAALTADGYDTCVEFGPKRVMTLAKKNNRAFSVYHVEDTATLKKAREALA